MDNFYVTPDGTIAKLPQRSFLDRLTSGLYDASVEYRKPGGGQEARLGRNQPLTSALNRFGEQKRSFGQEEAMLGKQQGFTAGQNEIKRNEDWAMADFEAGRRAEADRLRREQDAQQFKAVQGLNEMKRFDDIYNANRTFISQQELMPLQRQLTESQIAQNAANTSAIGSHAGLWGAQAKEAMMRATPAPSGLLRGIEKDRGLPPGSLPDGITYGQLRDGMTGYAGKSGQIPDWLRDPNNMPGGLGSPNGLPGGTNSSPDIINFKTLTQ